MAKFRFTRFLKGVLCFALTLSCAEAALAATIDEQRTEIRERFLFVESEIPPALVTYLCNTCPYEIVETLNRFRVPSKKSDRGHLMSCVRVENNGKAGSADGVYCASLTDGWHQSTLGFYLVRGDSCSLLWEKLYGRALNRPVLDTVRLGIEAEGHVTAFCHPSEDFPAFATILLGWDGRKGHELFEQWRDGSRAQLTDLNQDGIAEVLYLVNIDSDRPVEEQVYVYDPDSLAYRYDPAWKTYEFEYNNDPATLVTRILAQADSVDRPDSAMLTVFISLMPRQIAARLYREASSDSAPVPLDSWMQSIPMPNPDGLELKFCAASDHSRKTYVAVLEHSAGLWRRIWDFESEVGIQPLTLDTVDIGMQSPGEIVYRVWAKDAADLDNGIVLVHWNGDSGRSLLADPIKGTAFVFEDRDGDGVLEMNVEPANTDAGSRLEVFRYSPKDSLYHLAVDDSVESR